MEYTIEVENQGVYVAFFAKEKATGNTIGTVIVDPLYGDFNRYPDDYCKPNGKLAWVVIIKVDKSYTNRGIATSLMRRVIKNFHNWNIGLVVAPCLHQTMSQNQLKEFYSKFGFVRTKELCCTMIRRSE